MWFYYRPENNPLCNRHRFKVLSPKSTTVDSVSLLKRDCCSSLNTRIMKTRQSPGRIKLMNSIRQPTKPMLRTVALTIAILFIVKGYITIPVTAVPISVSIKTNDKNNGVEHLKSSIDSVHTPIIVSHNNEELYNNNCLHNVNHNNNNLNYKNHNNDVDGGSDDGNHVDGDDRIETFPDAFLNNEEKPKDNSLIERNKRSGIADQRLAELLELARLDMIRKLVRDSSRSVGDRDEGIAYGLIDPSIIGRRRRRHLLNNKRINQKFDRLLNIQKEQKGKMDEKSMVFHGHSKIGNGRPLEKTIRNHH